MKYQFTCSGTLEEVTAVIAAVQAAGVIPETTVQVSSHETPELAPDDIMYKALTRVKLTDNTRNMLQVLYDADGGVTYSELYEAIGLDSNRVKGVLSRFSARFHGTEGYDGKPYFKIERDPQKNEWCYQLTDELRKAVRKLLGKDSTH